VEIEPLNVSAHRGIIDASYRKDGFDDLVESYENLAGEHPEEAEYRYFYGYAQTYAIDRTKSVWNRIRKIDAAIATIEQARELDSQIIYIHQTLGWLYLQKGFWVERFHKQGGAAGEIAHSWGLFQGIFGFEDPVWQELAIDSFLTAFYLAKPDSLEQAWIGQNLGQ